MSKKEFGEAATKFLDNDFSQCFQQMRYYDGQIFEIVKHSFVVYSGLLGLSLTLYKIGLDSKRDFILPSVAMLLVGLVLGLYLFALIVRNRVYFVLVTRYINEYRGFFLKDKPLGFKNETRMYTNSSQPPYFNWCSSQSWFLYLMAFLNSTLMITIFYIFLENGKSDSLTEVKEIALVFFCFFLFQVVLAISYLNNRENKSASHAVFGKS